jgi:hypothetical protein
MKRPTRHPGIRRHALLVTVALLATSCGPRATAHSRTPPQLGVTKPAAATAVNARVGVLSRDGAHYCTASVVHSEGRDLIATAAHCLGGGGEIVFVPGYRDGKAPYGEWVVTKTYVADGWKGRQDEDSDVAFARVTSKSGEEGRKGESRKEESRKVEDVVGANPLLAGRGEGPTGGVVTVVGYPKASETPVSCTNTSTAYGDSQQRIECPGYSSGTSGSPWIDADGKVVGVLGGHLQGGDTDDVSYSVVLGAEAAALWRRAGGEF